MSHDSVDSTESGGPAASQKALPRQLDVRLWPAWVILVVIACAILLSRLAAGTRIALFAAFLGPILGTLAFLIWWLAASRAPWKVRGILFAGYVFLAVLVGFAMDFSMLAPFVIYALPLAVSAWTVALALTRTLPWNTRTKCVLVGVSAVLSVLLLFRLEGVDGSFNLNLVWRWQPRQEDVALETLRKFKESQSQDAVPDADAFPEAPGSDWAEFRGPRRDGRLVGVQIETDWSTKAPLELWRRPVGPGWSSFAVVGNRAYTQEQRGDHETVVCYDTATGGQVWEHLDKIKFDEAMGGVGPRATPTVVGDKLYALGAMGTFNCLDAATGQVVWSTSIATDAGAKVPTWGFASSPLVVDDLVVVYAGAADAGMIAYDRHSGEQAWTCPAGSHSYSSPHLVTPELPEFVLMMSNAGLTAADAHNGSLLWQYDWALTGDARIVQPAVLDGGDILVGTGSGLGTHRVSATKDARSWQVDMVWESRNLKPYFNDFVCHNGLVYGFDDKIMACVDPETGDRVWKGGRYGYGQLLLLADQNVLLVLSERGDAALVEAKPDGYKELAKFRAMDGKTWNHPVVAHGKLFVRNAEEAVCYELSVKVVPGVEMLAPVEE